MSDLHLLPMPPPRVKGQRAVREAMEKEAWPENLRRTGRLAQPVAGRCQGCLQSLVAVFDPRTKRVLNKLSQAPSP